MLIYVLRLDQKIPHEFYKVWEDIKNPKPIQASTPVYDSPPREEDDDENIF